MNLIESLALLAIAAALLFFGRGRNGDALPFLQKGIAAYMFAIVVFALFVAGIEGTAVNLGWLR
jgi:uncharacterized membrane protein SpoIIM required for sporulation